MAMTKPQTITSRPSLPMAVPLPYRLLYLYLEPVSTLVGAIYAHFLQHTYLSLTHAASAPDRSTPVPMSTSIVLTQLANLYLLLSINEALVLRATADLRVWKPFLLGLLIADLGHLYSVRQVGASVYWAFWHWNAMDWGNVGFVYLLAASRVLFLARVGFRPEKRHRG